MRALRWAPALALVLAAALVASLGGCGGGQVSSGPAGGAAPGSPGSSAYRWLVRTAGAPPSSAQENAAPGTSAWRLPGPARLIGGAAHGAVEGYVAEQAIRAGETQTVYVSAPGARSVTVQVFRIGWYGGRGGRLVLQSSPLPARRQPPCAHSSSTGLTECDWHPTLRFAIPETLASGVYLVKLTASDGARRDCMFVVRSRSPAPLVVQIPTATYEAYNAWGGDSLYPGGDPVAIGGSTQGVEVSYDRPYDSETGAGQFFVREVAIVRFLERYGYPVSYTTDASISAEPRQLEGARAVIDAGHSEYWSERQAAAFRAARDRGTSLLFLSSDTLAWRVRYASASAASSEHGARAHRIIAYKQSAALDPSHAAPSGLFPAGGAPLAGSAYNGCITPRLPLAGPPSYRYYAWAPARSLTPAWLFAGSGVDASTRIPGIVGYELDERTAAAPTGTVVVGESAEAVPCQPETEPSPVRGSVAQSTLYTAPSGALVFATGTLGWLYGLYPVPEASPDVPAAPDARVVAITRNLLARVLGG